MRVSIDVRGGTATWDENAIERLALFALSHMDVPDACEVSISLVDASEIQELNRAYRGLDNVTDVLSFPCDDPWEEGEADVSSCHPERSDPKGREVEGSFCECLNADLIELGDVVMCCDVIEEQRVQFGTTFEQEASLMLVHSILHLLGYDHLDDEEAAQMEALEKEILDAYGLTGIR